MYKQGKVSPEEKVRAVEAVLRGELGVIETGRRLEVHWTSVREWVKKYEAEGASAFIPGERQRSYSLETKEASVKDYLSGRGSLLDVCRKYKIRSKDQLRTWLKMYNSGKDFKTQSGGSRMTKVRKTSQEERVKIARECLGSGKNYGEVALKYQVSYQQVYTWVKKYAQMGDAGVEDRRGQRTRQQTPRTAEEELRAENARLKYELYMTKMERDLLKKVKELERRDRWDK